MVSVIWISVIFHMGTELTWYQATIFMLMNNVRNYYICPTHHNFCNRQVSLIGSNYTLYVDVVRKIFYVFCIKIRKNCSIIRTLSKCKTKLTISQVKFISINYFNCICWLISCIYLYYMSIYISRFITIRSIILNYYASWTNIYLNIILRYKQTSQYTSICLCIGKLVASYI